MADYLLNKGVVLHQPKNAFRAGLDGVLLSASVPYLKTGKICDVGCGVGTVGLCYTKRHNSSVHITGLESQQLYAQYANKNIVENGLQDTMEIINANLADNPFGGDVFNVVMTNPPYEQNQIGTFSNNSLKDNANIETDLNLYDWISACLHILKARGYFVMIHKMQRLDSILHALHNRAGDIHIVPIKTKLGMSPKRVIVLARKAIKSATTLHDPITIQNEDGSYSDMAQAIMNGEKNLNIKELP